MKPITLVVVGRMTVAVACAAAACLIAYEGKDGWGWFLFAAIWLGAVTVTQKDGDQLEGA